MLPDYLMKSDLSCLKFLLISIHTDLLGVLETHCAWFHICFFLHLKYISLLLSPPSLHDNSYSSFKSQLRCYFLRMPHLRSQVWVTCSSWIIPWYTLVFPSYHFTILHYNYSVFSLSYKLQKNMSLYSSITETLVQTIP